VEKENGGWKAVGRGSFRIETRIPTQRSQLEGVAGYEGSWSNLAWCGLPPRFKQPPMPEPCSTSLIQTQALHASEEDGARWAGTSGPYQPVITPEDGCILWNGTPSRNSLGPVSIELSCGIRVVVRGRRRIRRKSSYWSLSVVAEVPTSSLSRIDTEFSQKLIFTRMSLFAKVFRPPGVGGRLCPCCCWPGR